MMCFFHLVKGDERVDDPDGIEVEDVDEAFRQVAEIIAEIAADGTDELNSWRGWFIEAVTSDGTVLFRTPLGPSEP